MCWGTSLVKFLVKILKKKSLARSYFESWHYLVRLSCMGHPWFWTFLGMILPCVLQEVCKILSKILSFIQNDPRSLISSCIDLVMIFHVHARSSFDNMIFLRSCYFFQVRACFARFFKFLLGLVKSLLCLCNALVMILLIILACNCVCLI